MSLLVYLFTIAMGLVFGVLSMKNAEIYWTQEYFDYACRVVADQEAVQPESTAPNPNDTPEEN